MSHRVITYYTCSTCQHLEPSILCTHIYHNDSDTLRGVLPVHMGEKTRVFQNEVTLGMFRQIYFVQNLTPPLSSYDVINVLKVLYAVNAVTFDWDKVLTWFFLERKGVSQGYNSFLQHFSQFSLLHGVFFRQIQKYWFTP